MARTASTLFFFLGALLLSGVAPSYASDSCNGLAALTWATQKHFNDGDATTNDNGDKAPVLSAALSGECQLTERLELNGNIVTFVDPTNTSYAKNYINETDFGAGLGWTVFKRDGVLVQLDGNVDYWMQGPFLEAEGDTLSLALTPRFSYQFGEWYGDHTVGARLKLQHVRVVDGGGSGYRIFPAGYYSWDGIAGTGFGVAVEGGYMIPFDRPFGRTNGHAWRGVTADYTFGDGPVSVNATFLRTGSSGNKEAHGDSTVRVGIAVAF